VFSFLEISATLIRCSPCTKSICCCRGWLTLDPSITSARCTRRTALRCCPNLQQMKTHKVYKDRCTYHYIPNGIEAISYDSRYQVRTNSGHYPLFFVQQLCMLIILLRVCYLLLVSMNNKQFFFYLINRFCNYGSSMDVC
jgi:hypothetical protein